MDSTKELREKAWSKFAKYKNNIDRQFAEDEHDIFCEAYSAAAAYYEQEVIPQKVKEVREELIEKIDRRVINSCLSLEFDAEHCLVCDKSGLCYIEDWDILKKEMRNE